MPRLIPRLKDVLSRDLFKPEDFKGPLLTSRRKPRRAQWKPPLQGGWEALTKPDIVSTTPAIHGDWVLFHPVYTEDELRAVKVRYLDATARSCTELM